MALNAKAQWGMLYANDAGIVSRSSESLEIMISVIVRVAGQFGLIVSEPKTETMCMLPKGMEGVSVHGQRWWPGVQADGPVRLPGLDHHRGRDGRQRDFEPYLLSMEVLPPA